MCMTASTLPNAPLYFGKSDPNTCSKFLHASANSCFVAAGRRFDGSIVISSSAFLVAFMAGAA